MTTMSGTYRGKLLVDSVHEQFGSTITTDAPVEVGGSGTFFSPTDLCALALGTCALTGMGRYGEAHGCDIIGTNVHVEKKMGTDPRRIASIEVVFTFPDKEYTDQQKVALENVALNCPMHHSLHPEMVEQKFTFKWAR